MNYFDVITHDYISACNERRVITNTSGFVVALFNKSPTIISHTQLVNYGPVNYYV